MRSAFAASGPLIRTREIEAGAESDRAARRGPSRAHPFLREQSPRGAHRSSSPRSAFRFAVVHVDDRDVAFEGVGEGASATRSRYRFPPGVVREIRGPPCRAGHGRLKPS